MTIQPTFINRSAFFLRCKQPFVDWMNALPRKAEEPPYTLEDANRQPEIFLVGEFDNEDEFGAAFERQKPAHFENMMEAWITDETLWHKDTSPAEFDRWFEVVWSSMVIDLEDDEIFREDE